MIYLYNKYDFHKYWAPPFNNLLDGLKIYFNKKKILCEYVNNKIPSENDLIIAISSTINTNLLKEMTINNCKLIVLNSECVNLSNNKTNIQKSKDYMNRYINYSNLIQIWDYSLKNINFLKKITSVPCYYVPITYLPSFENIYNNNTKKEYDILLFGCTSDRRASIRHNLIKKGFKVKFGTWNDSNILKDYVNKVKIVIIIHYYEDDLCIDYYRLYSLISSKIFTISEMPSNDQIDPNMNKLIFSKYDNFVDTCCHYLSKTQKERDEISNNIYNWWKDKHPITKYMPPLVKDIKCNSIYKMTKNILITGGCGFIGHHFVEHIHKSTDWNIIIIDKLSYASNGFERLRDTKTLDSKRVKVFPIDLINPLSDGIKKEIGNVDIIVHMAAETHVDNSIKDPKLFIKNNIDSTYNMLEYARELKNLEIFFYFSTDEVFGPALNDTLFKEWDRHKPTNPYSASKSAAEQICISYENTYKVPLIIVNVMNAFGERQHVEKFIPLCIKKIMNNEKISIHSYPDKKTSGTRFYIHARNIAAAIYFLIKNGKLGEKYNISGEREVSNLEMAQLIANFMDKKLNYEMVDFHTNRPGHDLRYGLDGSKLFNLGFKLPLNFEDSLRKTVHWTLENKKWLEI